LPVAQIALIVGQSSILNANITDERVGTGAGSSGGTVDNSINDFRLTLTSGTPVTTADVIGAGTIYCTPYKGNRIALYDGANWSIVMSAEFSLALSGLTFGGNIPYDVFCYNNAGTPTLLIWTNTTTRATALVYQDGVLVESGAPTRRYLGTFIPVSATTTTDSAALRYLENYNNQVDRPMSGTFSTDRTTTSASIVELNAEIQIKWVVGVNENPMLFYVSSSPAISVPTDVASFGVGINSTSAITAGLEQGYYAISGYSVAGQIAAPTVVSIGYSYATLLGQVSGGGTLFFNGASALGVVKTYLLATKKG
jgi:hypothetical protein